LVITSARVVLSISRPDSFERPMSQVSAEAPTATALTML
jgi:hypothetical protein